MLAYKLSKEATVSLVVFSPSKKIQSSQKQQKNVVVTVRGNMAHSSDGCNFKTDVDSEPY